MQGSLAFFEASFDVVLVLDKHATESVEHIAAWIGYVDIKLLEATDPFLDVIDQFDDAFGLVGIELLENIAALLALCLFGCQHVDDD